MKLTRRFSGHVRLQGGAIFVYSVMLDGEVVGTSTIHVNKKTRPWTESVSYAIGERTFTDLAEFKQAIAERAAGGNRGE